MTYDLPSATGLPHTLTTRQIMGLGPVIPVVVLNDSDISVELAHALLAGGVRTMEITLRTPAGLESIRRVAAEVPGMLVGAGTVTRPAEAEAATQAGGRFLVSPGTYPALLASLEDTGVPFLPGAATASEAMALRARGHTELKFFPAAAAGGPSAIKALAGPLPDVTFCPTGGVTPSNVGEYLSLPTVGCVGGSWLLPAEAIEQRDWARITALAHAASALRR